MASMLSDAARWLVPSATAASAGAIAAGVTEALRADAFSAALCAAGLVVVLALPALFGLDVAIRGLWSGWQPRQLSLVEADGSAPRFAAWALTVILCLATLAATVFAATRALGIVTSFSPLVVSFLEPVVAVVTSVVLVTVSRPLMRALASVLRRVRGLTVRRVITILAAILTVSGTLGWLLVVRPALGTFDISVFAAPAVGIVAWLLVHAGWRFVPARASLVATATVALASVTAAFALRWIDPPVVLSVWGDLPVAGFAVEVVFDLDAIRADIPASEFAPQSVPGARHRDIIVITIDTVRADHTPPYGGHAAMPTLASLAERGVVFDWAFAPSNVTRRSIPSMMLGLQPDRVRGRVVGWALRLDPRHVMLAERMRAGGYETAGFMCCEGFWGKEFHTGLEHGLEHLEIDHNGLALARRARDWLDHREQAHPTQPLFVWMHILEPHNWSHFGPEPHSDAERGATYDRALAASDAMIKEVLAPFAHRPPDEWPIVIVTADHGEGLGEHGHPFHSTDLYDSQVHVPLVIAGPGIAHRHVDQTVSLTDLAPTVLELAGFAPAREAFDGVSLGALAEGAQASDPRAGTAFAAMIKDRSNPGGITAIIAGAWKLIDDHGDLELYDVRRDPGEHTDLVRARPEIARRLRELLVQRVRAGARSPFER